MKEEKDLRAHKQSLYRAYRPESFADVVGQDSIVHILEEQINTHTAGHAYLFSGSRGLGKTSVARIFARALGARGSDLYEIDAASNNTVDDIRALSENVYTLPFESPYKVYLLDEAHMLSKSAWNAFLKTLEEPPAHAIFILATTELEKVPETVQSRCQVFQFKKPTRSMLQKIVMDVAVKEGYELEIGAADLVALLAGGSYRDALSVLQKVIGSSTDKKLSREAVEKITGAPSQELVFGLLQAVSKNSLEEALRVVAKTVEQNSDLQTYLSLVLDSIRNVLLVRHAPAVRDEIAQEVGADAFKELQLLASEKNSALGHHALRVFLDASERMRFAPVPALALELALYELLEKR
jgi:DNA polymerase-3 subunit gamma/tau